MKTMVLEIRDEGTFIPLLAVDMNPGPDQLNIESKHGFWVTNDYDARTYLLRRVGYPCDARPNVLITRLSGDGSPASNDPYRWGGRTMPVAHKYIIENWEKLRDGDVVDVQFILGETKEPKVSERLST